MNDDKFKIGKMASDIEWIKTHLENRSEADDKRDERIGALETWRNGLVVAGLTIIGIFTSMGVTLQKALAAIEKIVNHQ